MKDTKTEINEVRQMLYKILSNESADRNEILRMSQKLDKLIIKYYKDYQPVAV